MTSLSQLQEIPSENTILLVGSPGSGKSSFCEQIALQSLAIERPIVYVTTECAPSKRARNERNIEKCGGDYKRYMQRVSRKNLLLGIFRFSRRKDVDNGVESY